MPRDYAHYKRKKPKPRRMNGARGKKTLWLILIIIIFFVLIIIRLLPQRTHHKIHSAKKIAVTSVKAAKNNVNFDFYTILPKEQVDVSSSPSNAAKNNPTQYVLRVISIQDADDAKHIQDELTLLGLDVYIDQIQSDGEVWNRINVGPYFSKKAAESDQKKLAVKNIKTILRLKK